MVTLWMNQAHAMQPVHEGTWYYDGRQPVYEQSYRYFVKNEQVHILFDRELDDPTRLGIYRFMKAWAPFTKTENRRAGNPLINLYETLRGGLDSDTSFLRFYFFAKNIDGDKQLVEQMSQREESLPSLLAYENVALGGGKTLEGDFVVDPSISRIAVVVLGAAPHVELTDPAGSVIPVAGLSGPNLEAFVSRFYEQSSPAVGTWRYRIINDGTDSATYSLRVKAESSLRMVRGTEILRSYNTSVPFQFSLVDGAGLRLGASIQVVARPLVNGKTISDTVAIVADLNDSGTTGDDTAADGAYSSKTALPAGVYTILARAEGEQSPGIPFRRLYQMVLVNNLVSFFMGDRSPVGLVADATPEITAELVSEKDGFFKDATYRLSVGEFEMDIPASGVESRMVGPLQVRTVRQPVAQPQPKGAAITRIKVLTGNRTRPFNWTFSITASEAVPPVLINEVSMVRRCAVEITHHGSTITARRVCKRRPGDDWVELYAREPVDISHGYALTTLDQFAEPIVLKRTRLKAGEYAVVHVGELGVDEDDAKGDANGNGVRDLYVSKVKFPKNPTNNDEQVVLKRWDQIVDAVCLTNGDDHVSRGEDVDQALVIGQKEWAGPFPPADLRNSAVHGGTLTSVGRKAKGDDSNRSEDWEVQTFPSPGADNVGALPHPPVGSILITEVQPQGTDQWVELTVVNGPIDLSRLFLTGLNEEGVLSPLAESPMVIPTGGKIQIHWNLTGISETDDLGDVNKNGVRELYLGEMPLKMTDDQLLLSSLFDPLDAVIWTRGEGLIPPSEVADANEIVAKGMWTGPFSPQDTSLAVLLPPAAFSIGRKVGNPDANSSADWVGMAPTPGAENMEGEAPTSQNIVINEVHPNDFFNDDRDWAELFVKAGPVDVHLMKLTNLDGKDHVLGLRPITLQTGEFAVVWFDAGESTTLTEYDDVGDRNRNGYRDIYIADRPLYGTDDQMTLMFGKQMVDAVAWTNGDGRVWKAQFKDERDIVEAGQWVGDYIDTASQDPSVFLNTLNGSISRFPNGIDTNKKDDWRVILMTPGHPNVETDNEPPTIVIDPVKTPTNQDVTLKIFVNDNVSTREKITVSGDNSPYTSEGQQDVTISAADEAGNSASASTSFFIDKTNPFFVRFSPAGGETFVAKRDTILISVEAKDAVDPAPTVFAQLVHFVGATSDTAITVVDSQQISPASMLNGQWKLAATAKDAAGNVQPQEGGLFTVINDLLPPRTTLTVGDPKFVRGSDSAMYVTMVTPLTFSSVDDLVSAGDSAGLGVSKIAVAAAGGFLFTVTGPVTLENLGAGSDGKHTVSYGATDAVGNVEDTRYLVLYVDKAAPVTSAIKTPSANKNSWNAADVTVTLASTDPAPADTSNSGSGVRESRLGVDGAQPTLYGTAPQLTSEGNHTLLFFSVDNIGNTEPAKSDTVRIDRTAPTVTFAQAPAANTKGWNREAVTVSYTAADTLAGMDTALSDLATDIVSSEGQNKSASAAAVDNAGNTTTVTVAGINIDSTPPSVTVVRAPSANGNGWNNGSVTVSYSATDLLSGVDAVSSDLSPDTFTAERAGQIASASAVDVAGNTTTVTVSDINIDLTRPSISAVRTPTPNNHGWNNSQVTVTFDVSDTLSGVDTAIGGYSPVTRKAQGARQVAVGSVTDKAGNISTLTISDLNIDLSSPALEAEQSPPANVFGWNNSPVSVTYSGTDALSGLDVEMSDTSTDVLTAETAGQTASATLVDLAGNTTTLVVSDINIDRTAPDISISSFAPDSTGLGMDGRSWWNSSVQVSFGATDLLSGLNSNLSILNFTISNEGKDQTATAVAIDFADNTSTLTAGGINIDLTAPRTILTIGAPKTVDTQTRTFVTSATTFTLTATDTLSGVAKTEFRLDGGAFVVGETFTIPAPEGLRTAGFRSTDVASNVERENSVTVAVDNTPPATTLSVDITDTAGIVLIPESLITLSAMDGGAIPVGLDRITYSIDGGPTQTYSEPFSVSSVGSHTLTYRSFDRLGNPEATRTFSFTVKPALSAGKFVSFAPRVLVWLNDPPSPKASEGKHEDDEDEKDKGIPPANAAVLKSVLDSAPILLYDIVNTSDSFVALMRTDSYNVYFIIGDKGRLENNEEWELSERVRLGDGLIASSLDEIDLPVHDKGEHEGKDDGKDNDNHEKDNKAAKNLLGVDVDGKHSDKGLKITLTGLAIPYVGEYQTMDKTKRVRAIAATAVGDGFVTLKGDDKEPEPTVVSNAFVAGKTVFFAFDVGRAATPANAASTERLLRAALRKVTPTKEVFIPNGRSAVGIAVRSLVAPVNLAVRAEEVLPAGASVVNKLKGDAQGSVVVWNLTLDVNESDTLHYVLGLPNVGETADTTRADIFYVVRGSYILFDSLKLGFVTEKDLQNLLDQAIGRLNALTVADPADKNKVKDAVEELQKQRLSPPATQKQIEDAIADVLEIIQDLDGIGVDVQKISDIRDTLDKVVLIYGRIFSSK